jgi:hypothetical protein
MLQSARERREIPLYHQIPTPALSVAIPSEGEAIVERHRKRAADPRRTGDAPMGDTNCFVIGLSFHPPRPLTADERDFHDKRASVWTISPGNCQPRSSQPFGRWRPVPALSNDFFIDRRTPRRN